MSSPTSIPIHMPTDIMEISITEIILKGKGSTLETEFQTPIYIKEGEKAEIGLKSFSFYNSIPNITQTVNNCIQLAVPGSNWQTVSLETGSYELSSVSRELVEWIKLKFPNLKDVDENFKLEGNEATSKAEFTFKEDYGFNMDTPHSIAKVLGFGRTRKERGPGKYRGNSIVNITNISSILFNCNISEPNYINNMHTPFIFNCAIDVSNGYKFSRELSKITYKLVRPNQISSLRLWITDQEGCLVNLRNEQVTVTLSLRIHHGPRSS